MLSELEGSEAEVAVGVEGVVAVELLVAVELAVFELSLNHLLLQYNIQQPLETVVLQLLLMEQEMQVVIVHLLEQECQLSLLQAEVQEEEALLKFVLLVDQGVAVEEQKEMDIQMQVVQEMQVATIQLKAMPVAKELVAAAVAAVLVKMAMIEVV